MFMLGQEVIHVANEVHTELLTLTTSCQIYNLLEEALTREASKVLKSREEGKLVSREGRVSRRGERRQKEIKEKGGWERELSEGLQR